MAVFTDLSLQDAQAILEHYQLGEAISLSAISEGIENTNYFLDTQRLVCSLGDLRADEVAENEHWVLTIFENLAVEQLPFFCALTGHLHQDGLSVPAPLATISGEYLFKYKGKWGLIAPRFTGESVVSPSVKQCELIGAWLACMHHSLRSFKSQQALVRDLTWMQSVQVHVRHALSEPDQACLAHAIKRYQDHRPLLSACPQGVVHGDVFRDNVLFEAGQISGVLDFYNACTDVLIFDLAVAVNDWCTDENGCYESQKSQAMVQAYQRVRPFGRIESQAWHYCLELAALRFWLSRLRSMHGEGYQSQAIAGQAIKDPEQMKRIMLRAQALSED